MVKQVTGEEPVGRESKLLESIHVEESLSTDQMKQLHELIVEHADVFALDQHELGTADLVTRYGRFFSDFKQPPRRVSFALRAKVDHFVNEMLDHGVITPSKSPWGSPVVLVAKKDGSSYSHFCVDYRRLNAVTKTDVFPLPPTPISSLRSTSSPATGRC